MPPRGRNIIRSWVRGGNECIRSSIACHLIMYNSYEQAHSIKNVCLQIKADNTPKLRIQRSWLLHFTRKFNLAIPSRFPGSRLIAPLSFSCYGTMDILRFAPLLQWPDRSGFTPDSLFTTLSVESEKWHQNFWGQRYTNRNKSKEKSN